MEIFIGSSRESIDLVREIEVWLEEQGHESVPWDKPGLFMPGEQTFKILIEISRRVEAAIFIFGADDRVWYRGDTVAQPRDNVLIEYGLFAGSLGPQKAIVCRDGDSKHPVDLAGLAYIDISSKRRARAKLELSIWARKLTTSPMDPAVLRLQAKIAELEREQEELRNRLTFESEKSQDLEHLLGRASVADFSSYDLSSDGHWKLLFEYNYFQQVAMLLSRSVESPVELRELLVDAGSSFIAEQLAWHSPGAPELQRPERSRTRNIFLARKLLRRLRDSFAPDVYRDFIFRLPLHLRNAIEEAGRDGKVRSTLKNDYV